MFFSSSSSTSSLCFHLQFDINQLMTSVNVSQSLSPIHKPLESPSSVGSSSGSNSGGSGGSVGGGSVGGASGVGVEQSPVDRTKGFFPDESEPLLRCDSTSSKDSALSRNGSFITKGERVSCKTTPLLVWINDIKLKYNWDYNVRGAPYIIHQNQHQWGRMEHLLLLNILAAGMARLMCLGAPGPKWVAGALLTTDSPQSCSFFFDRMLPGPSFAVW